MLRYLKEGVEISLMAPALLDAILKAFAAYHDAGEEFFITSLTDGRHMIGSLHYKGLAFDIRIWNLKHKTAQQMAELLKAILGPGHDVVVEKDHIHVEVDPK